MNSKSQESKQRFTIKKFKVGAASVLIGTIFMAFANANQVQASEQLSGASAMDSVTVVENTSAIIEQPTITDEVGNSAVSEMTEIANIEEAKEESEPKITPRTVGYPVKPSEKPHSSEIPRPENENQEIPKTFFRTSVSEKGKDISNDINASISVVYPNSGNNTVVPDAGQTMELHLSFESERLIPGDFFTLQLSKEVDLAGATRPKEFKTAVWFEDSIRLVVGNYDPVQNSIKFVVHEDAKAMRNISATKRFTLFVNAETVTRDARVTATAAIGNVTKNIPINVDYVSLNEAKSKAVRERNAAVTSFITGHNANNDAYDEVTSVTYVNVDRISINDAVYTESDTKGGHVNFSKNVDFRIYEVPSNVTLNDSYYVDTTKLTDVTNKFRPTFYDNRLVVNMGNTDKAYVVVTKVHATKPKTGETQVIVRSELKGIGTYSRRLTATTDRALYVAAISDSSTATYPAAFGNRVWHDLNKNGIQDVGEPGLSDVTVEVFSENGTPLRDERGTVLVKQTDENGYYYFSKIPAGTYKVKFTKPLGFEPTKALVGKADTDSNGIETTVTLSGENDWTIDSGFIKSEEKVTETKKIKRTITYTKLELDGNTNPAAETYMTEVEYTRTGNKDSLTGRVKWNQWTPKDDNILEGNPLPTPKGYEYVNTIKSQGDILDKTATKESTTKNVSTTPEMSDIVENVYFRPVQTPPAPTLATGNVVVNYVDEAGNVLDTSVNDEVNAPVGKNYNTSEYKKEEILSGGQVYELVSTKTADKAGDSFTVREGKPTEVGNVVEGTTYVTYVYKEKAKGSVIVDYVNEQGNHISGTAQGKQYSSGLKDTESAYVGTNYDTDIDNKPTTITTADNKVYDYVKVQNGSEQPVGQVKEGITKVTYVYKLREEKPQVEEVAETKKITRTVNYYKVEKNFEIKEAATSATTEVEYTRTGTKDPLTGEVTWNPWNPVTDGVLAGNPMPTVDGYKYESTRKSQGTVQNELQSETSTTESIQTTHSDANIIETVYFVPKETDTPIPPAEQKQGDVVVKYVKEGTTEEIAEPVADENNQPYETAYNTSDRRQPEIKGKDGKVYVFVKRAESSAPEEGIITKPVTTVVYEYKEKEEAATPPPAVVTSQRAVIIFEDGDKKTELTRTQEIEGQTGEEISPDTPTLVGSDTTKTIEYYEARGYEVKSNGFDTTPVYDKVEGNVQEVKIVLVRKEVPVTPEDPTDPKDPKDPTDPIHPDVPDKDKPNYPPGVSRDDLNKTVTRTIHYWIERENGEKAFETKTETVTFKRTAYIDSVTGELKRYSDWTVGKFTEVESPLKDGYTVDRPVVSEKSFLSQDEINALPNGKEFVEHVIYTPKTPEAPKTGTVVIEYVDTKGNPIKTSVVDDKDVPVGTDYDTTDEDGKPSTITVGEDKYVLVPSLTQGTENGKVVEGTTTITYVYQKVANWIPLIPGEPNPPKTPYPFDPENPENPIPAIPEVPGKPGVPVIPYVPGYEPKIPLVPVDPEDPTKGYIPPVPENPGVDTLIPYKPVPPMTPTLPGIELPAEPGKPTPLPTIPETPVESIQPTKLIELPKTGDEGSVVASVFGIGTLLASVGLVVPRREKD